jgi:hypothetical protein
MYRRSSTGTSSSCPFRIRETPRTVDWRDTRAPGLQERLRQECMQSRCPNCGTPLVHVLGRLTCGLNIGQPTHRQCHGEALKPYSKLGKGCVITALSCADDLSEVASPGYARCAAHIKLDPECRPLVTDAAEANDVRHGLERTVKCDGLDDFRHFAGSTGMAPGSLRCRRNTQFEWSV